MLQVNGLTKRFGDFVAVDNISFTVKQGEVLGFLGPNGAGKSTTMKMIVGFLEASSGKAQVGDFLVGESSLEAKRLIGYVPENAPLYVEMYVEEFLFFMGEMHELEGDGLKREVERVIEMCSLEEVRFQQIDTLSKGYKRRVSLAQALLHDPKILILDEPTDGLDPNQKYDVRKLIRKLAQDKGILISTHILEEVEEVCDRCIIIGQGKKLFEGTPADLKAKSEKGRIQDVFRAITTNDVVEGVVL